MAQKEIFPEEQRRVAPPTKLSFLHQFGAQLNKVVNWVVNRIRGPSPATREKVAKELERTNPELARQVESQTEIRRHEKGHEVVSAARGIYRPAPGHERVPSERKTYEHAKGHEAVPSEREKTKKSKKAG
jgi:hypothetical protein